MIVIPGVSTVIFKNLEAALWILFLLRSNWFIQVVKKKQWEDTVFGSFLLINTWPSLWKCPPSQAQKLRRLGGTAICRCDSGVLDVEKVGQLPALPADTAPSWRLPACTSSYVTDPSVLSGHMVYGLPGISLGPRGRRPMRTESKEQSTKEAWPYALGHGRPEDQSRTRV